MIAPYRRKIALRAENVGCDRAGAPVVRGVTFAPGPGEAVQLFGANGSGKTSLLNLFAGHLRPAEGAVSWREDNGPWTDAKPAAGVFFMGHEYAVKPSLTALENLGFWARTYGLAGAVAKDAAEQALVRMGLDGLWRVRAGRLSAGQRRRIDFARALLCRREVWLLDEPAAALDAKGATLVAMIVTEHLNAGGMAIIATHDALNVAAFRMVIG